MFSRLVKKKKRETTCKNVFILLEHRALFSFPEGLETKAIFPSLPRSQRRTRFPEICSQASCSFRIDHPYGTWGKVHLRRDKLSYHLTSIRQTVGYGHFTIICQHCGMLKTKMASHVFLARHVVDLAVLARRRGFWTNETVKARATKNWSWCQMLKISLKFYSNWKRDIELIQWCFDSSVDGLGGLKSRCYSNSC